MKIQVLPPADARLIAAGEVIESPSSAVRELLDNAIDAQPSMVKVFLEEGGMKGIHVIDDGMGMEKNDLEKCILVHATSKIRCLEDLNTSTSLGFRGEALASLTACSHLSIISRTKDQSHGYILRTSLTQAPITEPTGCEVGTKVSVQELFFNLPARKRFLKGATYEQKECEQVFLEKALAHPHIQFYFFHNNHLKHHFVSTDRLGRATQVWGNILGKEPLYLHSQGPHADSGFEVSIIAGQPNHYYHNRRHIHIYVNGRRINDYALVQAVLHSYSMILPGGQFPAALVFLHIRPDLLDFNIHPAKKEVKMHHHSQIHKAIVHLLGQHLQPAHVQLHNIGHTKKPPMQAHHQPTLELLDTPQSDKKITPAACDLHTKIELAKTLSVQKKTEFGEGSWYYIGQALGVFLIVERDHQLFLIDQHAVHERIIFDELSQKILHSQKLITPQIFSDTDENIAFILTHQEQFLAYGIQMELNPKDPCELLIHACPAEMDISFLKKFIQTPGLDVKREIFANIACKKAIKEGEIIDNETAHNLIHATFALKEPFCPHGRPLWIEINRQQLYEWIKRIV
ncbi:MAG: DNA mismatch repair endonuclease MutL [Spirochaetia bacterium]